MRKGDRRRRHDGGGDDDGVHVVDLDLHVRVDLLDLDLLASSISNYYVVDLPVTLEE